MNYKQAIVMEESLKISNGKIISQACHASLGSLRKAEPEATSKWESAGSKKIILDSGDKSLTNLYEKAKRNKLPAYLVKDAGMTEVEPGSITALGIGPAKESKIDSITGHLALKD